MVLELLTKLYNEKGENMEKISLKDVMVGDTFPTNEGGTIKIVRIVNYRNITIQHLDENKHEEVVRFQRVLSGDLKNPYKVTLCGVGYLGSGDYSCQTNNVIDPAYICWKGMLARCYDESTQQRQPAYHGVIVAKDWHNYQNFAGWYYSNPFYGKGYQLDKDILISGNKIYSRDTCCLVPAEINKVFIDKGTNTRGAPPGSYFTRGKYQVKAGQKYVGIFDTAEEASEAYNTARSKHIREIAEFWKNLIDPRVYIAAIAYSEQIK